jgi:hypothetical protein
MTFGLVFTVSAEPDARGPEGSHQPWCQVPRCRSSGGSSGPLRLRIKRKKTEYNHLVRQWRCRENNLPSRTLHSDAGRGIHNSIASVPLA